MTHELGDHGVAANAVVPVQIPTLGSLEYTSDETFARTMQKQSIQEYVTPDDFAGAVAFLVSQDGTKMTEQTLICDGRDLMREAADENHKKKCWIYVKILGTFWTRSCQRTDRSFRTGSQ